MSAGAGSVLQHVVANGGKTSPPLFRAAMTSSTFLPSQYNFNDRIPEVCSYHWVWFFHPYLKHTTVTVQWGCQPDEVFSKNMFLILTEASFSCSSAQDTLECLRAADVNSLQSANVEINASGFFGTFVFVPVVDGSFITERPTELLKAGKVNGVRWLRLWLPKIIMTILLFCRTVCFRLPIHLKATFMWIKIHQLRFK